MTTIPSLLFWFLRIHYYTHTSHQHAKSALRRQPLPSSLPPSPPHRLIRLTSPNLNYIIGFGVIFFNTAVYFFVFPEVPDTTLLVFCNVSSMVTAVLVLDFSSVVSLLYSTCLSPPLPCQFSLPLYLPLSPPLYPPLSPPNSTRLSLPPTLPASLPHAASLSLEWWGKERERRVGWWRERCMHCVRDVRIQVTAMRPICNNLTDTLRA